MSKSWIILFIFIAAFAWNKYSSRILGKNKLPTLYSSTIDDPCLGKRMCGVIYTAPWCPACKSMIPIMQKILQNSVSNREFGFLIIVGAGNNNENEETFKLFTSNAIIDSDQKISRSLGVSYYPSIFVIDALRTIKLRDQEALNWMQEQFLH